MEAVEHAVESLVKWRFIDACTELIDLWGFLTDKTRNPQSAAERKAYKVDLHERAVRAAKAVQGLIGDKDSTYLHGMVYNWPVLGGLVGMILRVSMEGFEHANKVWGEILTHQTASGGRRRKGDGGRKHQYMTALEVRREGTAAMQELGRVNHTSSMHKYIGSAEVHDRLYDTAAQLQRLRAMKVELEAHVDEAELPSKSK